MSLRTTPLSDKTSGPFEPSPGKGPAGLLRDLALGDRDVGVTATGWAAAVPRPPPDEAEVDDELESSFRAAGDRDGPDTPEQGEQATPAHPAAFDDPGQVVGQAQVVVLDHVVVVSCPRR